MIDTTFASLVYFIPMLLIWALYSHSRRREEAHSRELLSDAREAGLTEPPSLHPIVDPSLCVGCGTCVRACPESDVLGLIEDRALLVQPTACIGHGACKEVCPRGAIELVLGSEKRGVEIPHVGEDFQTNVPGLFVAGELGGMGLIRNATAQGCQAVDAICAKRRQGSDQVLDLIVIGAGPAGIAASLRARELGLRTVTLEQDTLGGTVAHYPRGKIVMTAPMELPLYGKVKLYETTKEALIELWTSVVEQTGLEIRCGERVTAVETKGEDFVVKTETGEYQACCVLLAIGRRGTPRKLGIPGEEQSKVVYRLVDPEQYRGQRVLVVGGGDSALEAALALAAESSTNVTLCYRSAAFSRAKPKNRKRLEDAVEKGDLQVLLSSSPREIGADTVLIETEGGMKELANDVAIICAGGILPTPFLRAAGVEIETRHGEAA